MGWQALANHQGIPAWFQAIGSVAAIVAAIQIASRQANEAATSKRAAAADSMEIRVALLHQAMDNFGLLTGSLQAYEEGVAKASDSIEGQWTRGAYGRFLTTRMAIDSIEFRELVHPAEFYLFADMRIHLDEAARLGELAFLSPSKELYWSFRGTLRMMQGIADQLTKMAAWYRAGKEWKDFKWHRDPTEL